MAVICPDCKSENTEDSEVCKTCGTSIERPETLSSMTRTITSPQESPKETITFAGRYEILTTLGRGGMGDVYRVRDIKLQEEMALKQLRPEIASDPDIIQRFRNELKLARKITHRNVCRVFDFHEEAGTPFITMEYVEGENLKSLIKRKGTLEESEAVGIAIQIVEGLAEAHNLGVVHRDLKPQNIMIEPSGRAKIMDFGIARSVYASGLTQTGQMIGTPDYLSSEQAAGQPADHRADIYALGVILYEMTTGKLPFKGDTALSVITKHRETDARNPREINPEISEGLGSLILRCMEKDKELRYQSSLELLADLKGLKDGIAPQTASRKARGGMSSSRRWIGIIGISALALVAAFVFLWQKQVGRAPAQQKEERPSLAVVYFENNTGDEGLSHWRKGFAELFTTVLSQSKYLNVLSGDQVYSILSDLGQLDASSYSSDTLNQLAQKGRVRHILRGSYIKAGSTFRVSVSLRDMDTGELAGSQTAEADGEENLFALVDDLTQKLKIDLNLTSLQIESDFAKASADVVTSSPDAYKFFIEGLRHHHRAEYQQCIEYMDKAIAIDPEFASAHAYKAFSYDSSGYHQEFAAALKKAFELRHRATERERLKFTAYYYSRIEGDIPKALQELQMWARLYPEDIFANHQLGYLYWYAFEDYEKAAEYLTYNVENRVKMFYSFYMMAWVQMCLGNYDKAREVCEIYVSEIEDHPEIRASLSIAYLCQGEYDKAWSEMERAIEFGFNVSYWNNHIKGGILQAKGDLAGAERHYKNLAESRDVLSRTRGREDLGGLALLQGRYQEALQQLSQALDIAESGEDKANMSRLYTHMAYINLRTGNYRAGLDACDKALEYGPFAMDAFNAIKLANQLKGLCQLQMDDSEAALNTAQELKAASEGEPSRRAIRYYHHLTGSVEMKNGNAIDAIKHFEEAASLLPAQSQSDFAGFKDCFRRTIYLDSLAQAYFIAEDLEKARETYESLSALTIGRHHWGDLYVKAFYWLGRISEIQGKTDEAVSQYRHFLELWNDADPGIIELSDTGKRLEALTN